MKTLIDLIYKHKRLGRKIELDIKNWRETRISDYYYEQEDLIKQIYKEARRLKKHFADYRKPITVESFKKWLQNEVKNDKTK